jgi:NAD+ diphosphatase
MKFTFCPVCGAKLSGKQIGDEGVVDFCVRCNRPFFDNPAPCVIALVLNEKQQICLLKSNYISSDKWTLVAGFVKHGSTLEENIAREVQEETGQIVYKTKYIASYYFEPGGLIMAGYIAYVNSLPFGSSNEVDDIMWCDLSCVNEFINRENNLSGIHFDNSMQWINNQNYPPE